MSLQMINDALITTLFMHPILIVKPERFCVQLLSKCQQRCWCILIAIEIASDERDVKSRQIFAEGGNVLQPKMQFIGAVMVFLPLARKG